MRKKLLSILALLCLTVSSAWALNPRAGDTWDETTKTLTVNSNPLDLTYAYNLEIEHLVIGESVTSIGVRAFYHCRSLQSVTIISTNVTSIGVEAFLDCIALQSCTIPASKTSIGNSVFEDCSGLTSITIPNGITSIGQSAFKGCSGLTSVSIPNSVTSIGEDAFKGCYNVNEVFCYANPSNLTWTELNCDDFRYSPMTVCHVYDASAWTAFTGVVRLNFVGDLAGKDESDKVLWQFDTGTLHISGTGDMRDYDSALVPWNGLNITNVVVGDGVTSIGKYAFRGNNNLTSATVASSVTSIGNEAFAFSGNSTTVIDGYPYIPNDAFLGGPGSTPTFSVKLTAHEGATGEYWTTFYNQYYGFLADENTQVFKVELSGTGLTMHEVTNKFVNTQTAVVLKSTNGNPVMTRTIYGSSNTDVNSLVGVYDLDGLETDGTFYVLGNGAKGVGFYKLATGKKVGFGKAYLTYSGSLAREFFGLDEATSITNTNFTNSTDSDTWYTIDGRRVEHPTKGIYIVNGKKVFIK